MKILLLLILLSLRVLNCWSDIINCTGEGTFRKMRDPTCQHYYTCTLALGTFYVKTDYTCPAFQRFNPTSQMCTATAICIDSFCDNQPPLATMADPNALDSTCRTTYIQCEGYINQYPVVQNCSLGCC